MKNPIILLLCFCTFILNSKSIKAQNLVPNPSFEDTISCPLYIGNFDSYIANWITPTYGSSDFFHPCSSSLQTGVPQNAFGWQQPRTGSAYVGAHGSDDATMSNSREYIQCQLTVPLVAGEQYEVSFWVSRADSSTFACDNIGAYLSSTPVSLADAYNLPFTPQVVSSANNPITDAVNWTQIIDTITAIGGEQYLTIGVFTDDVNTNIIPVSGGWQQVFHYYYDDASVIQITGNTINEIGKTNVSLFPNPSDGNFIISSAETIEDYTIYSVLGQMILSERINNTSIQVDLRNYPKGIYYINIKTQNAFIQKKLIINL